MSFCVMFAMFSPFVFFFKLAVWKTYPHIELHKRSSEREICPLRSKPESEERKEEK